jgi:putative SOS response-associated peptidase YedK
MCGRFTQTRSWQEIVELYKITEAANREGYPEHRYNIAPTQDVAVVRHGRNGQGRALRMMRWGLIPPWAEDARIGSRMINARAETIEIKPAFRAAFRERRCLVLADGFYEWQKQPGRAKQPYHVSPADAGPVAFAGLWERWRGAGKDPVETCAIITTQVPPGLLNIHDRMPVILRPEVFDVWLDPRADPEHARDLLRPFDGALDVVSVARRVNDVRNDDAACMEPPLPLLC